MINWSAIDPRSTPGRIVRLPARLLPKSAVMHIRRGPARGMKWIADSAVHRCWLGTFELTKQKLIERLVRPGMTVYDVGAQAGSYTLMFSSMVGATGHVIAFEPCAYEARYLLDHLRLNSLSNVKVIQAAVGAVSGLGRFSTERGPCQNQLQAEDTSRLLVPVLALDDAGLAPPEVIKMDIEGGETDALLGARRMLREHRPVVLVALHGSEQRATCPRILREAGLVVFDLDGKLFSGSAPSDEIYALPRPMNGFEG